MVALVAVVVSALILAYAAHVSAIQVTKELYYQYLLDFDKDVNRVNNAAHFGLFARNAEYIEQNNNCKLLLHSRDNCSIITYLLGFTQFTDMISDEIDEYFGSSVVTNDYNHQFNHEDNYNSLKYYMQKYRRMSYESDKDTDIFSTFKSLNWATMNNPLSKPIVTTVRNQGNCGACWAFVATAAIESTIYITTGYDVKLSVQELIDCDTTMNKGCAGGNPLYAYQYTEKSGLTTWNEYPYKERNGECSKDKHLSHGFINGYTRIPSNNQFLIQQYLKLGPVSVGVCGTDPSFLFYSSGVFNVKTCCATQNHAMLLVGYDVDNSTGVEYFIALNSWGNRWGENGFMKIEVSRNSSGTCGIALNPAMPFSGYLVDVDNINNNDNDGNSSFFTKIYLFFTENRVFISLILTIILLLCVSIALIRSLYIDYLRCTANEYQIVSVGSSI